jgi:hypothetical protein
MENFLQWVEKVNGDDLQNELILILHHIADIEKNLQHKEIHTALQGLGDVRESVKRLMVHMTPTLVRGIGRTTES